MANAYLRSRSVGLGDLNKRKSQPSALPQLNKLSCASGKVNSGEYWAGG